MFSSSGDIRPQYSYGKQERQQCAGSESVLKSCRDTTIAEKCSMNAPIASQDRRSRRFLPGVSGCFYRLVAFLGALLLLSTWPIGVQAQAAAPGRAEVIRELQLGDNRAALSVAQTALKRAPGDCGLLSLAGIALTGLQETERALGTFREALANCPEYLPALEGAAQIEFARKGADTVALLRRILAERPDDPTANAMLATALRAQGSCAEALGHYAVAGQAMFPSRPDLLEGYGACLADTGDHRSALAAYGQLLSSHPNDMIRYDVALLQWKTHANNDALATLAPLLTGDHPTSALALASKIHEEKGETPEAVALLREAIVRSPDDLENYLDFAAIAFNHKSFQVGIDVLNAGLRRLPRSAPLFVARGVLEVQISQSEAAVADFEQAHRLDPKLSFAADATGILHSQEHQSSESLALFEAEAKQHADDPLLQYLLAEQLSEGDAGENGTRLQAAITAAKRAVSLDPNYQAAHDLLAVLYVRANAPELAIQQAEAALALDPNDQDALYQEIMARRRSGDTAQIRVLTARFNEARKENERRQQRVDRYSLQEGVSH